MNIRPDISPIGDGLYRLNTPYRHEWFRDAKRYRITVPRGFVFDGASIPAPLKKYVGLTPLGRNMTAALVHDFIYRWGGKMPMGSYESAYLSGWFMISEPISREKADNLFMATLVKRDVIWWQALTMYWAIRLFGWLYWGDRNGKR